MSRTGAQLPATFQVVVLNFGVGRRGDRVVRPANTGFELQFLEERTIAKRSAP